MGGRRNQLVRPTHTTTAPLTDPPTLAVLVARYTTRGSESASNRGVVAVGSSYPYYFLSTNHNLMPVSGDQGNIEVANYGPVAFKCDTFYVTFAVGCMFKRTKTGIQAITYGCLLLVERVVLLCAASNACSHRYTILYYTILYVRRLARPTGSLPCNQ